MIVRDMFYSVSPLAEMGVSPEAELRICLNLGIVVMMELELWVGGTAGGF